MSAQDLLPDSDALLVAPVRQSALASIISVRRYVLVLMDYRRELLMLPDSTVSNGTNGTVPHDPSDANAVFAVVRDVYVLVHSSLRKLVVNLTFSNEKDPLARDGTPNR